MNQNELTVKSEDGGDRVGKTKTIYDASAGEIVWKNFLAGFSRGVWNNPAPFRCKIKLLLILALKPFLNSAGWDEAVIETIGYI